MSHHPSLVRLCIVHHTTVRLHFPFHCLHRLDDCSTIVGSRQIHLVSLVSSAASAVALVRFVVWRMAVSAAVVRSVRAVVVVVWMATAVMPSMSLVRRVREESDSLSDDEDDDDDDDESDEEDEDEEDEQDEVEPSWCLPRRLPPWPCSLPCLPFPPPCPAQRPVSSKSGKPQSAPANPANGTGDPLRCTKW